MGRWALRAGGGATWAAGETMSSAAVWNVRGVGRETRAFAEEAARRAGMGLGDWLDQAVADKAAEQGVDRVDLGGGDALDSIAERLSRLAGRDDKASEAARPGGRDDAEANRDEGRRVENLLEAAIGQLETRAERREARAARTLESFAQWIERSQADRSADRAALQAVAAKLAAIEHRAVGQPAPPAEASSRWPSFAEAERELDARMNALARRVEALQERRREPPRRLDRRRLDMQTALSQIARRRSELDARAEVADGDAAERGWRGLAADPPASPSAAAATPQAERAPRPASPTAEAFAAPADAPRGESSESARCPVDVQGLRAEIAAMSRSLADLAPRNAVVALEGAMRDLSERIAMLRENGARDALVGPVEALTAQLREALRAHDPHAAVEGLEREIRAIDAKVDAIAESVIAPAAFERIRAQTEEIRNLLAAAATRPVPVERLERQIGDLADRIERLASTPHPQAESARVVALLSDARAQIERSTPTAALAAIERRLEQLAERMDQALQRPPPTPGIDARAIDDLARRIDAVRVSIERQSGAQPDAARVEAALRDISDKLDRAPATAAIPEALAAAIQDLGARIDGLPAATLDIRPLEQALRTLGDRPVAIDVAPIENMMRDLGAKLATTGAPEMGRVEGLLNEINDKLSRAAPRSGEIEAMIRDLGARIDQRVAPTIDLRPLEEALRALSDRLDVGAASRFDAKFVEQAADLVAERLGRGEGARVDADALAGQIGAIHDRLDALAAAESASAALDRKIADLVAELDATRRLLKSPPATGAGEGADVAGGLAELRSEQASADQRTQARLSTLQDILERLDDRLRRLEDEVARFDESAPAPTSAARDASPSPGAAAADATSAALRDIPDRGDDRPARGGPDETTRDDQPSQTGEAPPPRPLDGADFLVEPGASFARPRFEDLSEAPSPRSAANAYIAAARRAAQAAQAEIAAKESMAKPSAEPAAGKRLLVAGGGRAMAFIAAQRRPLLLGAALLAAAATFAAVELRGGRHPPMQKSELPASTQTQTPTPAQKSAGLDVGKVASRAEASAAAAVDSKPIGSIAAPLTPPNSAAVPAELAASIPAGLPPSLRDAAAAGDPGGELELALRLLDGRGVAKDARAAAQWLEQAARDLPLAQYRLAALYEKGVGVARDASLAVSWYAKAATAGNARAMHNLAVLQAEGAVDGKPDYADAAQWFRKAAELGIRDSQFNLGVLCARGMGVPQDLGQSWLWFSLAAGQGDLEAAKKRDEVAANLDPTALAAAARALAAFKVSTPTPAANEAPAPPGGWDGASALAAPRQAPCPRPWCA